MGVSAGGEAGVDDVELWLGAVCAKAVVAARTAEAAHAYAIRWLEEDAWFLRRVSRFVMHVTLRKEVRVFCPLIAGAACCLQMEK